jgi:ATP-binding protein involved in chromosome partitioning
MQSFNPTVIRKSDPARVDVEWDDGHASTFTPGELRRICPCAQCVNEITGKRMLDPTTIPDDLTQSNVTLVGNYAIAVQFADGHQTGIYTFKFLRENDPGPAQAES